MFLLSPALCGVAALRPLNARGGGLQHKVLPDTGLVLGIQYRDSMAYHAAQERGGLAVGVTGICATYRLLENTAGTGTVLVMVKAGGVVLLPASA